jgi:hypothetical protein
VANGCDGGGEEERGADAAEDAEDKEEVPVLYSTLGEDFIYGSNMYSPVQTARRNMSKIMQTLPLATNHRGPYMSKTGPT